MTSPASKLLGLAITNLQEENNRNAAMIDSLLEREVRRLTAMREELKAGNWLSAPSGGTDLDLNKFDELAARIGERRGLLQSIMMLRAMQADG